MSEPVFEALLAVFDELSFALLVLSTSGQVLFANHAASALLQAGWPVRLAEGRLHGKDRRVSASLQKAIDELGAGDQDADARLRDVCLAQPSAERPGAIAQLRTLDLAGGKRAFAVFIMQGGQESHHGVDGLAEAYRLSRAETRILKALAGAQGSAEAAASLSISLSTLKSHLRKIFQKTGTSRQAGLLRLVACCRTPFRKSGEG